jgi:hypothetical protein
MDRRVTLSSPETLEALVNDFHSDDFTADDFHSEYLSPRQSAPRRRFTVRRLSIGLLIVALTLAAGYGGLEWAGSSATANSTLADLCGQFSLTRRGLPCDIPLPGDATFIGLVTAMSNADGQDARSAPIPTTTWTFRTRQSLTQISAFYTQGLSAWWVCGAGGEPESIGMVGGENPNRPDTSIGIAASQPGASAFSDGASSGPFLNQPTTTTSPTLIRVSLMQSDLPFWWACNGS